MSDRRNAASVLNGEAPFAVPRDRPRGNSFEVAPRTPLAARYANTRDKPAGALLQRQTRSVPRNGGT